MSLLSRTEYERLLDQADIAAGREKVVPAEIVRRLISGASKVKVWRNHRGMTGRELAEATGLGAPYISEIEGGRKEGSIPAMKKIAEELRVDLDDLA